MHHDPRLPPRPPCGYTAGSCLLVRLAEPCVRQPSGKAPVSLSAGDGVAERDGSRDGHECSYAQAGATFTRNRSENVEVSLDASGLCARGHDAAFDPHPDLERCLAHGHRRPNELVLAVVVDDDVLSKALLVPGSE